MFDALRLSMEVLAEVLAVEAMDTECNNLYVVGAQSLVKSICALLLCQESAPEYYL